MHPHERQRAGARRRRCLGGAAVVTFALTGCLTIEEMAPPVGAPFALVGMSSDARANLERGREVYISDCARCHSIEPVDRYSVTHWCDIIERMSPQAGLDDAGKAALRAYLIAAHKVMTQEPAGD
jgi:hypothetical protein